LSREPVTTVLDEVMVNLSTDSSGRRIVGTGQQSEEGTITAAVIKHPPAGELARQGQRGCKPPAVAPGDQPIAAVYLLARVMTRPNRLL
jgi:hypothetical protein